MRLLTVLLTALLLMPSSTVHATSCPPATTITRVMPLGDSNTMGSVASGERPYVGYRAPLKEKLLAERYAVDLVGNKSEGWPPFPDPEFTGWAGWSIEYHRPDIAAVIEAYRPQAALVLLGTNDMFEHKNEPPAYPWNAAERLETFLELMYATDPCLVVIVSEIPDIWGPAPGINPDADYASQWVAPFNAALPSIVSRRAADGQRIKLQHVDGLETDGLHFTEAGYHALADRWYDSLRSFPGLLMRTPAAPQPINPNGTLTSSRPTFRWEPLDDPVNEYAIYDAGPNGQYDLVQTFKPSAICGAICAAEAPRNLQDGPHTYWLIAWNGAGWGYWSDAHSYCIRVCTVTPPPAPTVIHGFPTIRWSELPGAVDGYAVYSLDEQVGRYSFVKTVDREACANGVCTTSWPLAPSPGWHTAYVIAWNAAGWGTWSAGDSFCRECLGRASVGPSPSPGVR